jgi:general secretion pathway protein A
MNKKLLSLYSLKFNPFSPEVPTSALWSTASIESFCWRIEQQIGEGGFALAIGDPGTGKSAALRILVERLGNLADVMVGVLTRPQAAIADFYRELGHYPEFRTIAGKPSVAAPNPLLTGLEQHRLQVNSA